MTITHNIMPSPTGGPFAAPPPRSDLGIKPCLLSLLVLRLPLSLLILLLIIVIIDVIINVMIIYISIIPSRSPPPPGAPLRPPPPRSDFEIVSHNVL